MDYNLLQNNKTLIFIVIIIYVIYLIWYKIEMKTQIIY